MYTSSTSSSSSQGSLGPNGGVNSSSGAGLIRYGSAPSSLLAAAVDSAMNPGLGSHHPHMGSPAPPGASSSSGRLFFPSSEASTQLASEPSCRTSHSNVYINGGARRAYGLNHEVTVGAGGGVVGPSSNANAAPPPLVRHSSSPAGFLNQLAHAACTSNDDSGYTTSGPSGVSRLNSQLSFTRQETLSKISEESENVSNGLNLENEKRKSTHSYSTGSYGGASWEDAHTIMFSMGPSKRPKNISSEVISGLTSMESQFQFGMPHTMLEMASMDKLLNIPEDSVPCKIRAKRGCATHPRSIAERERRTRISGKLKKLQDLVPNMDKQTSYADMLDLAVQHIKGLQNQVQKLNKELENCTCGCRNPRNPFGEEKS